MYHVILGNERWTPVKVKDAKALDNQEVKSCRYPVRQVKVIVIISCYFVLTTFLFCVRRVICGIGVVCIYYCLFKVG